MRHRQYFRKTHFTEKHLHYLSFAHEFTGLLWHYGKEFHKVPRTEPSSADWRDEYLSGKRPVDDSLVRPGGEIAVNIIADILENKDKRPSG